jgi:uncharacterized protein with PQ loop repeat
MVLWLIYGLVREDPAIVLANVVGSSLTAVLVVMKLVYDGRDKARSGITGP